MRKLNFGEGEATPIQKIPSLTFWKSSTRYPSSATEWRYTHWSDNSRLHLDAIPRLDLESWWPFPVLEAASFQAARVARIRSEQVFARLWKWCNLTSPAFWSQSLAKRPYVPQKTRVLYNEGPRFITTGQAGGGIDGAASIDFGALQGSVDRLARPTIRPESYLAAPKSREPIRNAIRPLKKSFRWPWISSSAASGSSAATRAR